MKGTNTMLLVLCVGTISVALGIAQDDPWSWAGEQTLACKVSKWSDWGECVRSPPCPSSGNASVQAHAHRMRATTDHDIGRTRMRQSITMKKRIWRNRESCTSSHSCPQNDQRATSGYKQCVNGLSGNYPCRNIDLMSFLNFADLTGGMQLYEPIRGNDLWGWTDPVDDQEYVLMGTALGTSFIRITNPESPVVLGFFFSRTYSSIWRDIKVVGNFAYIGSEAYNHGMQIFDLTRLRNIYTFREFKESDEDHIDDYLEVANTHNVVANEDTNMIYLVGASERHSGEKACKGGLHMVDVSSPRDPQFVGCFKDDGYTHDAQCVVYKGPDTNYYNHEICFNYNEDSLTIVDVTNKYYPTMVSKLGYDGSQYTHQGWLTEDHRYILMDDELDEFRNTTNKHTRTLVWDVLKLTDPKVKKEFLSTETAIDHNQYIKGSLSYQSNYEAGLRIIHFDQSNWDMMKEVAYFDVYPSRTTANFGGTWSNYPYFKSGVVAVSSVEYGLFIVKPDMEAINANIASNMASSEQHRSRHILEAKDGGKCPHPVETRPCRPKSCEQDTDL